LIIPDQFNLLREATLVLSEFDGRYDKNNSGGQDVAITWTNYLSSFRHSICGRIELSSTAKPFTASHYSSQLQHPSRYEIYSFIRNNALNLKYSIDSKIRTIGNSADISEKCYYPSSNERYLSLNTFMKTWNHNQNMVMASQDDCHSKLSLSEFISFGSLRAGHRLQLHHLADCILNKKLSFDSKDVFSLWYKVCFRIVH